MIRKTALVTLLMIIVRIFLLGSATQAEFYNQKSNSVSTDNIKTIDKASQTNLELPLGTQAQKSFEQKYSAYFEKLINDSVAYRSTLRKTSHSLQTEFECFVMEQLANE